MSLIGTCIIGQIQILIHSVDLFGDVSFHCHNVRRCNVVFFASKPYEIHVNASVTVPLKFLAGFLFIPEENWKHLKDELDFSSFLVC